MAELKKPYEISIWEDELDTSSGYYREKRIAVIGTDTMTSPNKAFSPVLKKNVNGEKSLTFSMAYTYFDPITGLKITNPFIGFLINERKVKLHYQGEWFDFLIKTHEEDSESMVWTFTATDAFVDELSKNGYNIEFSTELDNNQGTAIDLGKATLKNTDWEVDEQNSDVLVQKINEPMIIAKLNQGDTIDALDVESNNIIEGIDSEDTLYIFYSYLSSKEVKNVQFMLEADEEDFIYDDKGNIIGPNYRITSDVTYLTDSEDRVTGFTVGSATVSLCTSIDGEPLYTSNQGYRIVYGPLTTYDPVMERTVNIYETGTDNNKQYVYDYIDYTYTTSNVVTSLVTNGSNFNTYESGSLQGWDNATPTTNTQDGVSKPQLMQLTTYPEIGTSKPLLSLSNLTSLRGFMELKFEGTYTNYKNTYYNSGFRDNSSLINNVVAGQEYVLRLAYATTQGNVRHGNLVPFNAATTDGIRVVVAQWENKTETSGNNKIITKSIIPGTTILDFNGSFVRNDTVVEGGSFNNDYTQYLVDNVPQTPSNNCIYRDGNNVEKVWDSDSSTFINVDDSKFIHYYLTTTTAKQSLSNEDLTNSLKQVGIFLYINNSNLVNQYIYLADIQLTKCVRYGTNNTDIVTIGNIPEAVSTETHNYYLKPSDTTKKEEVEIYFDLQGVAEKLGCDVSDIKQVYNENCEKILSISEDHSNCFNILQTICETFECWLKLEVERDPDGTGAIKRDASGKQIKKVAFKTYAGKDNFAGFKYGINLKSINRTLTSDEIVTKLIVDNVQSEYTDSGTMTIRDAKSNPSGEAYILNFDYFIQKGLITNEADCRNDLSIFNSTMKLLNQNLNIKRAEANALEMARIKIGSQRTVYTELINAAAEAYNQGLKDFQEATNTTYERYLNSLSNILPAPDSNWHCSSYDQAEGVLTASTSQTIETYIYPAPIHVVEGQTYTLSCYAKSNGYVTSMDMYKYNASVQNIQSKNNMALSTDWELYTWTFTANATEDVTIRFDNNGSINQGTTATLYVKQPMLLMGNYDLTNSDEVLSIIGKIYTASITINTYSGLLSNIAKEYQELSEKLEGTKDYVITTSYVPTVGENTYTTRINFDGYIENVRFEIYNSENPSNKLEFTTTLNTKSFEGINNPVYNRLRFISLPDNYKIENDDVESFNIINGISKIKLIPIHKESGCTSSIQEIQDSKDALEKAFLTKYNSFIKEGTWSSNDYIDSELYYLDAVQVSNTSAMPKVEYSIDVAEVSEIEGLEAYLFDVGDKTYVEDTEFFGWHEADGIKTPAREEVIVSEVEWHLDEPETNIITVQNYKTQFEDLFQRISAAVQTVQYNEAAYAKTTSIIDADGTLNQNVLLASLNNISDKSYYLTSDGSITVDKDCITIRNLTNSSNIVKIDSRGINISNDGGNNWRTALTGAGINAGVMFTGKVNTEEVTILDEGNPSFRWDKYGISAYKKTSDSQPYDLSTFVRFDQYGLYGIKSNSSYVAQSLEDVKEKAHFGITWDGFFIKNSYTGGGSVQITSENDFQIFNADQTEKIKIGALEWEQDGVVTTVPQNGVAPSLYGIRIQNDAGQTVFKTGDDGNLEITGTIYATAGEIGGMTVNDDSLTMDTIVLEPGVGIYSTVQIDNHNAFHISDTDGSAIFRYIEALGGKLGNLNVIDTITVGQGNVSGNIRSANYVANTSGWVIDSTGYAEFANAKVRGHIDATSGTLNNLNITGGITVAQNGYIQSSNWNNTTNTGWKITDTGATFNNVTVRGHVEASTGTLGNLSVIDTITVGANGAIQSSDWNEANHTGWNINNTKATFNNADVRGTITALQGDFLGEVRVGPTDQGQDHIIIDGTRAAIKSSNYQDGAGYGWMINKDGDAVFNNITARGAIKTAVFEYSEIQAVGGIFIFRPSSTIRSAAISGNNLVLKVEKPFLFAKITYDEIENPSGSPQAQGWYEISQESFSYVLTEDTEVVVNKTYYNRTVIGHSWCKISNYTSDGREPNISSILATNGLTHVYEVGTVNLSTREVTLLGAKAFVDAVKQSGETDDDVLAALEGGALVDMGRESNNADYDSGKHNYGIGVNSSDNTVNLPARAISLFETVIDRTRSPKVSYDYKGILGTLPELSTSEVSDTIYNQRMAGTQGIFTNNMYIGDRNQYVAFYEDEHGDKQLRIKANQIVYEVVDEGTGQVDWHDVADIETEGVPGPQGPPGEDAIQVKIESNIGNNFVFGNREAILSCYVFKGITDITSQVTQFDWTKVDKDGNVDNNWIPDKQGVEDGLLVNQISIDTDDVDLKSVFYCNVTFA